MQLLIRASAPPGCLLLKGAEGAELAVRIHDALDGLDTQRSDQLILEVGVAHEDLRVENALEGRRLRGVAQSDELGAVEAVDEVADCMRAADRDHGDAVRVEVAAVACGECAERYFVAHALDEDDDVRGHRRRRYTAWCLPSA